MTIYEEALQLTSKLSLVEKVQLLEHLSTALKYDLEVEAYRHIPWEQFLELTYGSLADDPIERDQPLYPDVRDEIAHASQT
jgi:hypothetical protein